MSKSSSHAVQLFPFLAVLICAMGALILLLLVTTSRIKRVAVEKAIEKRRAEIAATATTVPPVPAPLPETPPAALEHAPLFVAPAPATVKMAKPILVVDEKAAAELRTEWLTLVEELARDYGDQVKLLASLRTQAILKQQEEKAAEEARLAEKTRLEAKQFKARQIRKVTAEDIARLADEQTKLDAQLKQLKKTAHLKEEELANQPVPYTLLPYDGALGTTRRPIIIECNERSLTFVCEGIELSAGQLSGFPEDYNPILAGTRALHEYWIVRDRENATLKTPPPPYVLLVVRPKGTVAFYVARKLLEKFEHPFGYELVEEGRELVWPASDEAAIRVCRQSVERVLLERERVLAQFQRGGESAPISGELRYDGEGGRFATQEVEQLRNLDDSVVVGGQRWKRDPKNPNSFGPAPFQSSQGGGGAPRGGSGSAEGRPFNTADARPSGGGAGSGGGNSQRPGSGSAGPPSGWVRSGGSGSSGPGSSGTGSGGSGSGGSDGGLASADPALMNPDGTQIDGSGRGNPNASGPALPPGHRGGPSDDRAASVGSTFQGSSGPRLNGGGNPGSGGGAGSGGGGGGGRPGRRGPSGGSGAPAEREGDLRPYREPSASSDDEVLPQGTGPINTRNLPRSKALAGGTNSRGTPSGNGSGSAAGTSQEAAGAAGAAPGPMPAPGQGQGTGPRSGSGGGGSNGNFVAGNPGAPNGAGTDEPPAEIDPFERAVASGTGTRDGSMNPFEDPPLLPGAPGSGTGRRQNTNGRGGPGGRSAVGGSPSGSPPEGQTDSEDSGLEPDGDGGPSVGTGSVVGQPGARGKHFRSNGSGSPGGSASGGGSSWQGAPGGSGSLDALPDAQGSGQGGGSATSGGQPGGGTGGGASGPGGSAPEGMPVPRNLRSIGQQEETKSVKSNRSGKPAPRVWGEPEHRGGIALERTVQIDIRDGSVVVEDEPEIALQNGTAYRELKDRLAFTLDSHVGRWGRPPASFYWLPNVTFRIHPGGNQYYQALKALTDEWELRSKVEYVLE